MTNNTTFKTKRNWKHFTEYSGKNRPVIQRLWRECDANDQFTFNRYGFGILMSRENGKKYFQCYIGYENWNVGGYGCGGKRRTIEEAYDDLNDTIICAKKHFGFEIPMKDRIFNDHAKDKQDMLDIARRHHMF